MAESTIIKGVEPYIREGAWATNTADEARSRPAIEPLPPPVREASSSSFWAWVAALVTSSFVILMAGWVVWQGRQQADMDAAYLTENYSRILEESLVGFIRNVDLTLLNVSDEFDRRQNGERFDDRAFEDYLNRQLARFPELLGLRVVDAQGVTRYAVGEVGARDVDLSDRSFFTRQRDDRNAGLVMSDPVMSRISGHWVVVWSRRLNTPSGSFAGDVHVAVKTEQLTKILARLDPGSLGNSGLWSRSALIARYASSDANGEHTGATTPSPQLRALLDSGATSASYQAQSGIDGVERQYHFRRVGEFPLYAVVGLATDDYLANWRAESRWLTVAALLFVGLTMLFAWRVQKTSYRRKRIQAALHASEERLDLCIDGADLAMVDWDLQSRRMIFGEGWRKLVGFHPAELASSPTAWIQLLHPEDFPRARQALIDHLKGHSALVDCEVRLRHRDGGWVWALARGRAVERTASGRALRVTGIGMDITVRKQAEAEIERLSQWNELLLNSAGEGIYGVDLTGRCTFVNHAALTLLGYSRQEIVGSLQHELFYFQGYDSPGQESSCAVTATLHDGVRREAEVSFRRKSGESFPVHLTVAAIHTSGRMVGAEIVFQDISRRKAMEAELVKLATTDALTGIANRRRFLEQVEAELARVRRFFETSCLLMMDVDRFKLVNDTYGHAIGDIALRHFADVCRIRLRQTDFFGRLGGEEFGILLPRTDREGAYQFAEALRRALTESPVQTDKGQVTLTVSIGVAEFGPVDETADGILVRADIALYSAKSAGRNTVVVAPVVG